MYSINKRNYMYKNNLYNKTYIEVIPPSVCVYGYVYYMFDFKMFKVSSLKKKKTIQAIL